MSPFFQLRKKKILSFNNFNSVSFKELIPQSFRSKDIVILNKFDDNAFFKKQILNNYLGIMGVPIAFGNLSRYTFDRIDSNSNLNIKVNSIFSNRSIYKNGIKSALNGISINTSSIQRRGLLRKRKLRRKLSQLQYLQNRGIFKKIKFNRLFKLMSNQIEKSSLNSRINFMVSSMLFKRHLFKYNKRKII